MLYFNLFDIMDLFKIVVGFKKCSNSAKMYFDNKFEPRDRIGQ